MMFLIIACLLSLSAKALDLPPNLKGVQDGQQLFLDIEDEKTETAFTVPGYTYATCMNDIKCRKVAWPDRYREIRYDGQVVKKPIFNLYKHVDEEAPFVRVKTMVRDPQTGEESMQSVWLLADPLKLKYYAPVFSKSNNEKTNPNKPKEYCPPVRAVPVDGFLRDINISVASIFDQIGPLVGRCPTSDAKNVRTVYPNKSIPYDIEVLPWLKKTKFPEVTKGDGQPATQRDFIAIDAHARTCFAEMGICAKSGPEYIFAWEQTALNRNKYMTINADAYRSRFENLPHARSSNDNAPDHLINVVTEPDQYQVWEEPNSTGQALCPPAHPGQAFYTADKKKDYFPSPDELEKWNTCLRVAIEGVLFEAEFEKARTPGFNEVYYISGNQKTKLTPVKNPVAVGRPLKNPKCMRVLREPKLPLLSELK